MSAVSCDIVLQALTETSCWRKHFFTFGVRGERNRVKDKMRVEERSKEKLKGG